MVQSKKKDTARKGQKQEEKRGFGRARKIKGSTRHGYTEELLSPYGGLLPLVKLWEALQFDSLFSQTYLEPRRKNRDITSFSWDVRIYSFNCHSHLWLSRSQPGERSQPQAAQVILE
jgi:hypothetical protein